MLSGKVLTAADALGVCLSSMLVVFAVLCILFVAVRLFPLVFREKPAAGKAPAPAGEAPAAEDDGELLAVIAAAVRACEEKPPNTGVFLARNLRR